MSKQATRLLKWFLRWQAAKIMLDDARPEEFTPESKELLAALLALAED